VIGNDVAAALAGGRILSTLELLPLFREDEDGHGGDSERVERTALQHDDDDSEEEQGEGEEEKEDEDKAKEEKEKLKARRANMHKIPDLHAKPELEEFIKKHEYMRWPEPGGGGVAEGAFNDMVVYWAAA